MSDRLRQLVAPAYLLLCLLLGGSSQPKWGSLVLQLVAVAILAWAAVARSAEPLPKSARQLAWLVALAMMVALLQLVPLPPAVWSGLPGRAFVIEGYAVLGQPPPWLPISLAPYDSIATIVTLLPALAMLAAIVKLRAYRPEWLVLALLAGTIGGVLLGVLQVSDAAERSSWYLYRYSNFGVATGFFANANHMAALLVVTVPFLAALVAGAGRGDRALQRYSALVAVGAGVILILIVGLVLNGSLAGLGLGVPVLVASALMLVKVRGKSLRRLLAGAGLLLALAVAAIYAKPTDSRPDRYGAQTSVESRREMSAVTLQAIGDFAPLGTGLGTFPAIYFQYEDPGLVERVYVNHAHNDYLEIALELGVPGLVLMVLFILWWTRAAWQRWRSGAVDHYARAATIASAAMLAHSLVDYPLRTAALASLFAMCLALISQSRVAKAQAARAELWPARHLEVR